MGRYSYSQPSSSEEYDIDITSLLQAEADLYADEADRRASGRASEDENATV
uniref:Uncharacterized protein n=1 Tax=Brassica campestris TaxID=3711 RepID=M4DEK6_BRACM